MAEVSPSKIRGSAIGRERETEGGEEYRGRSSDRDRERGRQRERGIASLSLCSPALSRANAQLPPGRAAAPFPPGGHTRSGRDRERQRQRGGSCERAVFCCLPLAQPRVAHSPLSPLIYPNFGGTGKSGDTHDTAGHPHASACLISDDGQMECNSVDLGISYCYTQAGEAKSTGCTGNAPLDGLMASC